MNATTQKTALQPEIIRPESDGQHGIISIPTGSKRRKADPDTVEYQFESVRPGAHVRMTKLDSDGNPVEVYDVAAFPGRMQCECGDHVHRGRECKHINAALDLGLLRRIAVDDTPPTVEEVAEELRAAEAEGGDMDRMLSHVAEQFGPGFADEVSATIRGMDADEDDDLDPINLDEEWELDPNAEPEPDPENPLATALEDLLSYLDDDGGETTCHCRDESTDDPRGVCVFCRARAALNAQPPF